MALQIAAFSQFLNLDQQIFNCCKKWVFIGSFLP